MLIYWKETTTAENIINTALIKHDSKVIERIEHHFGKLEIKLDRSANDLADLKNYANCTLGILRYHTKIDNKKAGKLADKLIEEFKLCDKVPKLEENNKTIIELLMNVRKDIEGIIKGEIKEDLSDFLENSLRDVLDLDKDESLVWEITKGVCRFSAKNIKMLLV